MHENMNPYDLRILVDQTPRHYKKSSTALKTVTTEKDLGVYVDCKLSVMKNMREKVKKASSIMAIIRRSYMYTYLDEHTFLYFCAKHLSAHI